MALHKSLAVGDIHVPYQWSYADATARGSATGFVSTDVGKLARQLDDNSLWMLTNYSPITWASAAHDAAAIHTNISAEISGLTEKSSLVSADVFVIEDSAASYAKKKVTVSNLPAGVDTTAIHKATAAEISAITEKTSLAGNDLLLIEDSAASYAKKSAKVSNLPVAAHATSHKNGGGDEVATATPAANAIPKADASSKLDSWVTADAAASTSSLRKLGTGSTDACAGNDSRLSDNRTDANAIHKNVSAEISTLTEKTTPVSADLLIIEDSEASNAKKKLQIGNVSTSVFGKDYTAQASEGESTTTSATFQDKVTLTTSALTGTYRLNWYMEVKTSASNKFPQVRTYNDTDATELGFAQRTFSNADVYDMFSGYANITFTGSAKTLKLQFANTAGGTTTVRRARISVWRVS